MNHPLAAPAAPSNGHHSFWLCPTGILVAVVSSESAPGARITPHAFISPSRGQGDILACSVEAEACGSDNESELATATRVLQPPRSSQT